MAEDRVPQDDGLPTRDANTWAHDKLDIVECYLRGFATACRKWDGGFVVDGFSGPGVNRFKDDGSLRFGTPLIALLTDPKIQKVIATDLNGTNVEALKARTQRFGSRAVVKRADVNKDLAELISWHIPPRAPCLVVLDPEGTELSFDTVQKIAHCRGAKRPELLILLSTHMGFLRMLSEELPDYAPDKMDRLYGTPAWREIWEARHAGRIEPPEATTRYVRLYAERLRSLGYAHVGDREIRSAGRGGKLGYFLLFAGDNDVGIRIMEHCFDTRYADRQLTLFSVGRPTRT